MSNTYGIKGFQAWAALLLSLGLVIVSLSVRAATTLPFDGYAAQRSTGTALCFQKLDFTKVEPGFHLVAQVPFTSQNGCADIGRYRGFSDRSAEAGLRRQNVDPDFGTCRFMAQDADRDYPSALSDSGEMFIQEPEPTRPAEALTF